MRPDLITKWAEDWQLSISVSKCNVLTIGKSSVCRKYYISDTELPPSTQCTDLGTAITSDLSPSDHISTVCTYLVQQITAKAHQRANILRCFVLGNISSLVRAFLVHIYVRLILEHYSVVWSPRLTQDIMRTEQVQRHFTKRLRGFRNLLRRSFN